MAQFTRYIGVDYSGAETAESSLKGLRVFMVTGSGDPVEVPTTHPARKYWDRRSLAEWIAARLSEDTPTAIGIDHGFSFPEAYFERHGLDRSWPAFLDDFCRHWPTDQPHTYVDFVRDGIAGAGALRSGNSTWRRLAERRAGGAKSVFHFDVPGSVAKSTHAGLPWLAYLRGFCLNAHFWPFDGWDVPAGRSLVVEVYPALWSRDYDPGDRTGDQHDAHVIARRLAEADRDGRLAEWLAPSLTAAERRVARYEGWILGVE
ncbi:MAG: hypothetical protein NW216_05760 [Hyphomicrobium sp.]|nr:hypothetical protein [Hyphomicrobium sp.]